jgi:hypothetical protein
MTVQLLPSLNEREGAALLSGIAGYRAAPAPRLDDFCEYGNGPWIKNRSSRIDPAFKRLQASIITPVPRTPCTDEPRASATCPRRYLSVRRSFPIISTATDWFRLRAGPVESAHFGCRMELGLPLVCYLSLWMRHESIRAVGLPHLFSSTDGVAFSGSIWAFVTGASLLADASNYCPLGLCRTVRSKS